MSDINTQRRQLLRGGASVPVVLTVQPGTALANSSAFCRTVDKAAADPAHMSPSPDGWLRCEVTKVTSSKYVRQNGVWKWVKEADYVTPTNIDASVNDGTSLACPKNVYYKLDANGNPGVAPETPPTGSSYKLDQTNEKKSALVLFQPKDEASGTPGHIKGFAWQDSLKITDGPQKIRKSCACSFV